MAKTVTNIFKLSPTHFVSNIRHQHRCSQIRVLKLGVCLHVVGKSCSCRLYVGKSNFKLEISYQVPTAFPTAFISFEIERKLSNFEPSIKKVSNQFSEIYFQWYGGPCTTIYCLHLLAICLQFACNLLAICFQSACNLIAISLQSAWNLFTICLQFACDQLEIWLQFACSCYNNDCNAVWYFFLVNVVIADASGSQEYVLMLVRYHIKEWIYLYKYEWAWMFMNFYELRWKWWIFLTREPFLSNRDKSLNR